MVSTLVNLIAGALIKLVSAGFGQYIDFKRQKELAILSADKDKIVALQSGNDSADWSARVTRVVLALAIIGAWVAIMLYVVMVKPEITYTVPMDREQSWVWKWLWPFPVNEKGVSVIHAGALLWEFKSMVEILIGFYFTKVGK